MLGSLSFGSVDPHRALAERLARVGPPESEPAREASASALDHVTRLCHRVVADLLFQELQVSEVGGQGWGPCQDREALPPTILQFLLAHGSVFGKQTGAGGRGSQGHAWAVGGVERVHPPG